MRGSLGLRRRPTLEEALTDTITEAPAAEASQKTKVSRSARLMQGFGWTFIWLGLLSVGFVFHQVYITSWIANAEQAQLAVKVDVYFQETADIQSVLVDETGRPIFDVETGQPIAVDPLVVPPVGSAEPDASGGTGDPVDPAAPQPARGEFPMLIESNPDRGTAFGNLRIPSLDSLKDGWNIVEGVKLRQLRRGAGHMPWTPLPGQIGNSVISGHRITNGAPFRDFDQLEPGDRIEVETAISVHVYEVRKVQIVRPTALWVTATDGPKRAGLEGGGEGSWLTLTTCHPKLSARQRLIVFAELVDGPNFGTIDRLTG